MKNRLMAAFLYTPNLKKISTGTYLLFRQCCPVTFLSKKSFFFCIACTFFISTHAQTAHSRKKENFDAREFQVKAFSIPIPGSKIPLAHIGSITVMDVRADTSHVGLRQKKVVDPFLGALNSATKNRAEQRVNKVPTFLRITDGLQKEASQFVNAYLALQVNDSLPGILMVIKKLWLSDELNLNDAVHINEKVSRQFNKDYWTSGIDMKIEFYLQENNVYYPLYRYDSIISKAVTVSEYAPEFVAQAIRLSMEKLSSMDNRIARVRSRRSFSLAEINAHNSSEFDLPALTDAGLCRGVYMNFAEFKNNRPSHERFELQKDRLTDIIYLRQPDGRENVERDVWGYCDGKNVYIKAGDNFFLLQRMENAFYIFGAKNIKWEEGQSYSTAPSYASNGGHYVLPVYYKSSKWELQLKPFQLDWSTGLLY